MGDVDEDGKKWVDQIVAEAVESMVPKSCLDRKVVKDESQDQASIPIPKIRCEVGNSHRKIRVNGCWVGKDN